MLKCHSKCLESTKILCYIIYKQKGSKWGFVCVCLPTDVVTKYNVCETLLHRDFLDCGGDRNLSFDIVARPSHMSADRWQLLFLEHDFRNRIQTTYLKVYNFTIRILLINWSVKKIDCLICNKIILFNVQRPFILISCQFIYKHI